MRIRPTLDNKAFSFLVVAVNLARLSTKAIPSTAGNH